MKITARSPEGMKVRLLDRDGQIVNYAFSFDTETEIAEVYVKDTLTDQFVTKDEDLVIKSIIVPGGRLVSIDPK